MTSNQIAYQDMLERKRSNLANEAENYRHHTADEEIRRGANTETARANRAKEANTVFANMETQRSNMAKEANTAADRESRERIERENRVSRENMASEDRMSRERVSDKDRDSKERMQDKEHRWSSSEKNKDRANQYAISDMTSGRSLTGSLAQAEASRYSTDQKFITDNRNIDENIRSHTENEYQRRIEHYDNLGEKQRQFDVSNETTRRGQNLKLTGDLTNAGVKLADSFIPNY